MAARVAGAGFPLTVWNRSPAAAQDFAHSTAATAAATAGAAARDADVVVTMLTDGNVLMSVLGGADGVLAGLSKGSVVVDCSTTGPELARAAARLCADSGVDFLDCPVSGSTAVASRGELGLMVGGDAVVLERVRPVLASFGQSIVHVGATGAGAAAKVAVNGLLNTFSTALAESLVAAEAAGVAPATLFDVLGSGVLSNRFLDYKRAAFVDPAHAAVAFDLATAAKDLDLAYAASQRAGLDASVIGRVLELHRAALDDGYGDQDIAAMAAWFGERAARSTTPETRASAETPERT
jgi:3-hydroxyisobutyrate dehydrogenase-like beta-hydroxyacid dehydrogenase